MASGFRAPYGAHASVIRTLQGESGRGSSTHPAPAPLRLCAAPSAAAADATPLELARPLFFPFAPAFFPFFPPFFESSFFNDPLERRTFSRGASSSPSCRSRRVSLSPPCAPPILYAAHLVVQFKLLARSLQHLPLGHGFARAWVRVRAGKGSGARSANGLQPPPWRDHRSIGLAIGSDVRGCHAVQGAAGGAWAALHPSSPSCSVIRWHSAHYVGALAATRFSTSQRRPCRQLGIVRILQNCRVLCVVIVALLSSLWHRPNRAPRLSLWSAPPGRRGSATGFLPGAPGVASPARVAALTPPHRVQRSNYKSMLRYLAIINILSAGLVGATYPLGFVAGEIALNFKTFWLSGYTVSVGAPPAPPSDYLFTHTDAAAALLRAQPLLPPLGDCRAPPSRRRQDCAPLLRLPLLLLRSHLLCHLVRRRAGPRAAAACPWAPR